MSFHEVRFPDNISYGSRGGPGFSTSVIETDSGTEERVARWSAPKHKYNARYGVKSLDDMSTLISFYVARQGPAAGFRYKDWFDFTTGANHRSSPAFGDVDIGVGDGTKTAFQLIKKYASGSITRIRNITKPVSGTVLIGLNGVNQASGWSVNTTTGIVTFSSAPGSTVVVSAGFEFDTPARFGVELDDVFGASYDSFDSGSIDDIPIVEISDDGTEIQDEFFMGGAKDWGVVTLNFSVSLLDGRVHTFTANSSGIKIILPDPTTMPAGFGLLQLINQGSQAVEVRTPAVVTVGTISASGSAWLSVGYNSSGVKIWLLYA